MAEEFPRQHTTTTTVTSNTTVLTYIRFDSSYIKTIPGILKCVQVVCNFFGFICIVSSEFSGISRGVYFTMVGMIGFWVSLFLLIFYLFHIVEKFYRIPWLHAELVFCGIWAFLYLFAASLAAAYPDSAYLAGAVFGFCAMVAYAVDTFFKYKAVKSGELAQGERTVSKQTTSSVSSPHY